MVKLLRERTVRETVMTSQRATTLPHYSFFALIILHQAERHSRRFQECDGLHVSLLFLRDMVYPVRLAGIRYNLLFIPCTPEDENVLIEVKFKWTIR